MPTIHTGWHTASKTYGCDGCNRTISKGARYKRLYGSASAGEKPYTIRLCTAERCGGEEPTCKSTSA